MFLGCVNTGLGALTHYVLPMFLDASVTSHLYLTHKRTCIGNDSSLGFIG